MATPGGDEADRRAQMHPDLGGGRRDRQRRRRQYLTKNLASYPVSVRRLLGFATPLPPLLPLPAAACGLLHLAVNTHDGTFTR